MTLGEISMCPNCKVDFEIVPGDFSEKTLDSEGEKYRPIAIDLYKKYRVTCPVCQKNFCAKCKSIPFHDGLTCEEKQIFDDDIFCRFCTMFPPVGGRQPDVCNRVCWHARCQEAMREACNHVCECGHACCGLRGESEHFGCALCRMDRYVCTICKRSCTESPSVVLRCGHPVHKNCLVETYKTIEDTNRTKPKKGIKIPRCVYSEDCCEVMFHDCVRNLAEKYVDYDSKIKKLIKQRIEIEDTKNEEDHVKNPADADYFGKPEKYARDFFIFHICEKCGDPYYAGHKECIDGNDDNDQNQDEIPDDGHRICLRCNKQIMSASCPKHGESNMLFKCMFCCKPALFLCYNNTTYFCSECHKHPSAAARGPFQKCDGHCIFAPHAPNGEKVFTGICVTCEQEKEDNLLKK